MLSQTRRALEDFDNQHDFERMAADVLNALGYLDVEPMAPGGGWRLRHHSSRRSARARTSSPRTAAALLEQLQVARLEIQRDGVHLIARHGFLLSPLDGSAVGFLDAPVDSGLVGAEEAQVLRQVAQSRTSCGGRVIMLASRPFYDELAHRCVGRVGPTCAALTTPVSGSSTIGPNRMCMAISSPGPNHFEHSSSKTSVAIGTALSGFYRLTCRQSQTFSGSVWSATRSCRNCCSDGAESNLTRRTSIEQQLRPARVPHKSPLEPVARLG